ncbi:MAG: tail fiber protein [Flavobacterium sp.]|nr:tail fiber protein [Flavobacterium sp.]
MRKKLLLILLLGFFGIPKTFAQQQPFIGQIMAVPYNFAPTGWAECNGQLIPLQSNVALFSLLGTTYGGNGTTNFALPDLRGRVMAGEGSGPGLLPVDLGESGGSSQTTLLGNNLPAHRHSFGANTGAGTTSSPANNVLANTSDSDPEFNSSGNVFMTPSNFAGGSIPINNMQPYLGLKYVIATQGIFPPRP